MNRKIRVIRVIRVIRGYSGYAGYGPPPPCLAPEGTDAGAACLADAFLTGALI